MTARKFFTSVVLMTLMGLYFVTVQAQSVGFANITSAAFVNCPGPTLEGSITIDVLNASGGLINGSTGINGQIVMTSNGGFRATRSWPYVSGVPYNFIFITPGAATLAHVDIYVLFGGVTTDTYRFGCDGTVTRLGGGLTGPDGRINPNNGDLISALYLATGKDGRTAIRVYDINAESVGLLRGDYTFSLFEPYIGKPPKSNTIITRIGRTVLIALNTGEFQINVGPDAEGKVHEVILNGMPPTEITFSFFYQR